MVRRVNGARTFGRKNRRTKLHTVCQICQDCHNGQWKHHAKLCKDAMEEKYDASLYPHMAPVQDDKALQVLMVAIWTERMGF